MAKHEIINVSIDRLENDFENARHPVKTSERDVIDWMLSTLGKEIYNLAEDIAVNGLSPLDRILVVPKPKSRSTYTVMEGNRRVLAVKLLNTPSLADNAKQIAKFEALRKTYRSQIPSQLEVVLTKDIDEAFRLIDSRHRGPNQGRGTMPWDAQDSARAQRRRNGKSARYEESLQLIDYAIDHGLLGDNSEILRDRNFPITTLERMLKDKDSLDQLGISYRQGRGWAFEVSPAEAHKGLKRVLRDLAGLNEKKVTVTNLKNKTLRQTYFSSLDSDLPSRKELLEEPLEFSSVPSDIRKVDKKRVRIQDPKKRKHLIDDPIRVSDSKITSTLLELREIDLNEFPRAATALIRIFLEQSIDFYLKKNGIALEDKSGNRFDLRKKFESAVQALNAKAKFERALLKALNGIANSNQQAAGIAAIDNLHLYLHSSFHLGKKEDAIYIWDSAYGPFLKHLWDNIEA